MTDYAIQRAAMVDSQVRPSDVTDRRIPRAMLAVPREAFVAASRKVIAYADGHLPMTDDPRHARHMLAPRTLAKLLQHLEVPSDGVALDIGCGTGYSTALLARLAHVVVTVEANSALAARARQTLAAQGVTNATVVDGPHEAGAVASGPYDVILINGLVADVPRALLDQMKDAGRLAAIVSEGGVGRAMLWRRFGMQFDRRVLFDADAAVLPGFERRAEFVF